MYHWNENRALTNRERARLKTFPDSFEFIGNRDSQRKQKQTQTNKKEQNTNMYLVILLIGTMVNCKSNVLGAVPGFESFRFVVEEGNVFLPPVHQ